MTGSTALPAPEKSDVEDAQIVARTVKGACAKASVDRRTLVPAEF